MAIAFPLAFPTSVGIKSQRWSKVPIVGEARSPTTGHRQVQVSPGQLWRVDFSLPPADWAEFAPFDAWLGAMNGREGTSLFGPVAERATPRGSAKDTPGTPVVNGASQTGASLVIDGCPASATGYLLEGDFFSLGTGATTRLFQLLEDANTDAGGNATLTIWPDLTSDISPADNDPLTLTSPKGIFSLAENVNPYDISDAQLYGLSLALISEP